MFLSFCLGHYIADDFMAKIRTLILCPVSSFSRCVFIVKITVAYRSPQHENITTLTSIYSTGISTTKGRHFFLKILCHIFESQMFMLPLKLTEQTLEMFPQKLF